MRFGLLVAMALAVPAYASAAGNTTPIDVTVDTGSHTCTSLGQEKKVYKTIEAGEGRYFFNESLGETSKFGAGSCEFNSDGGGVAYEKKVYCVTDADGDQECSPRLVKVIVRAFADCTNNPTKIGSRIGTECRFTATSKKGNPSR